ncbi:hypothetical protein [Candidatus Reidiella endopervernicosa]|uniref:Uncharacterized protein n=1 Tax=Candidatus Reidiella endopervernicosa TaxID=2738883 RepID=A0A6N0HW21_9GAMM|nr:hypothetical protein [Candidatus Reidiella endopervernicosa]QKQ26575.1 hypothetical protein HUE57_10005 [Candidatus Reidiella endopervernicosa]
MILILSAILSACGASSIKQLKQDRSLGHHSFVVPFEYQKAYRVSFIMMRDCYEANRFTGGFSIKGVIFPDIKEAEITASLPDLLGGFGYYFMTTITAIDGRNSRITVHHAHAAHTYVADDLRRWLLRDEEQC